MVWHSTVIVRWSRSTYVWPDQYWMDGWLFMGFKSCFHPLGV